MPHQSMKHPYTFLFDHLVFKFIYMPRKKKVSISSEEDSDHSYSSSNSAKKRKKQKKKPDFRKKGPSTATNANAIVLNVADCQYQVIKNVARQLGWKLQFDPQAADWDLFWTDFAVEADIVLKMHTHQKLNHFPGMYILARKNSLGKNLMKMRKRFSQQYNYFPLTWMLPSQYSQFRIYFQSKPKGKCRTYIVKPQALSQGKGIFLTRSIDDLQPGQHYVVQRYMTKPLMIQKLKFDLRIYILVLSVNPLKLFMYQEGLARFATQPYQAPSNSNLQDIYMHLTNYAINKDNPKFIYNTSENKMDVGHKRSLTSVYKYLQQKGHNVKLLKKKMEDNIIKSILSGLPLISHQYKACQPENTRSDVCFQILGLDILLTDDLEPMVLEINHTPSFSTDTPLDKFIKHNLIKDTMVLMNFTVKKKQEALSRWRQECNNRILTGKRSKLSKFQKQKFIEQTRKQKEKWQSQNGGRFKKIYPCGDAQRMQKYQQFYNYAEVLYYQSTKLKRKELEGEKPLHSSYVRKPRFISNREIGIVQKPIITKLSQNSQEKQRESLVIQKPQFQQSKAHKQIKQIQNTVKKPSISQFTFLSKTVTPESNKQFKQQLKPLRLQSKNQIKLILQQELIQERKRKQKLMKQKIFRLQLLDQICKNKLGSAIVQNKTLQKRTGSPRRFKKIGQRSMQRQMNNKQKDIIDKIEITKLSKQFKQIQSDDCRQRQKVSLNEILQIKEINSHKNSHQKKAAISVLNHQNMFTSSGSINTRNQLVNMGFKQFQLSQKQKQIRKLIHK